MDDYLSREFVLSCVDDFLSKTDMPIAAQYFYDCFRECEAADVQTINHTKNLSTFAFSDEFICENCGIHLAEWIKLDVEDYEEYEFKFCPECGAKLKDGETNG